MFFFLIFAQRPKLTCPNFYFTTPLNLPATAANRQLSQTPFADTHNKYPQVHHIKIDSPSMLELRSITQNQSRYLCYPSVWPQKEDRTWGSIRWAPTETKRQRWKERVRHARAIEGLQGENRSLREPSINPPQQAQHTTVRNMCSKFKMRLQSLMPFSRFS